MTLNILTSHSLSESNTSLSIHFLPAAQSSLDLLNLFFLIYIARVHIFMYTVEAKNIVLSRLLWVSGNKSEFSLGTVSFLNCWAISQYLAPPFWCVFFSFILASIWLLVLPHVHNHDIYEDEDTDPKLNCLNIRTCKNKMVCCTPGSHFTVYSLLFLCQMDT